MTLHPRLSITLVYLLSTLLVPSDKMMEKQAGNMMLHPSLSITLVCLLSTQLAPSGKMVEKQAVQEGRGFVAGSVLDVRDQDKT